MSRRWLSALLALAAAASMAFAPAGQPDPKRNPNMIGPDIDFALKELCYPWLKGEAEAEALTDRPGVVEARREAWMAGTRSWWVGRPVLTVALGKTLRGEGRTCTLRVTSGDPEKLRAQLDKGLGAWRAPFTPSVHRFPPGAYARRDVLCSPKDGPQDSVLISMGGPRAGVPMMVTLMTGVPRDPRCDRQL